MTETTDVRAGEELDNRRLIHFLRSELRGPENELVIEQFPAGSSNLTYLIKLGSEECVLRRPPFGNTVKTAHDMRREYDVLSKLSNVYPPAPKPLLFCDDESVIGAEFYLMERRSGVIVRNRLSAQQVSKENGHLAERFANDLGYQRQVCEAFVANLAKLHSLDAAASGLNELGKPDGYNRRQVEGWTRRYQAAQTHDWPELNAAIEWLNSNIPTESGTAIIHNDYKFDNVMLAPEDLTRVTAVLDWEMVTIGDPLMDLGTTLGYWISPGAGEELLSMPFNPRVLMENVPGRELVRMYTAASGREVPDMLFYYVFGTIKIAVIAQQIFARYAKGYTHDPRFSNFDRFVEALGRIGNAAIQNGPI